MKALIRQLIFVRLRFVIMVLIMILMSFNRGGVTKFIVVTIESDITKSEVIFDLPINVN